MNNFSEFHYFQNKSLMISIDHWCIITIEIKESVAMVSRDPPTCICIDGRGGTVFEHDIIDSNVRTLGS